MLKIIFVVIPILLMYSTIVYEYGRSKGYDDAHKCNEDDEVECENYTKYLKPEIKDE